VLHFVPGSWGELCFFQRGDVGNELGNMFLFGETDDHDIDAVEFARCRTMIAERVNRLRIRPPNPGNACAADVPVLRLRGVYGTQFRVTLSTQHGACWGRLLDVEV